MTPRNFRRKARLKQQDPAEAFVNSPEFGPLMITLAAIFTALGIALGVALR